MIATIKLENMEFRAGHGCYEMEKIVGNRFLVDVVIEAEAAEAAKEDDLSRSVNYLSVYETVREQMKITSNILENVAYRIVRSIYAEFPGVLNVTVTVSKIAPPLGGKIDRVSVTVSE